MGHALMYVHQYYFDQEVICYHKILLQLPLMFTLLISSSNICLYSSLLPKSILQKGN
jgi:hypothetical protein